MGRKTIMGTVEKIDAVVVSASIQEKARSDAARLNPFRAETFEGNFSESMDKHITYEVFFYFLSADGRRL